MPYLDTAHLVNQKDRNNLQSINDWIHDTYFHRWFSPAMMSPNLPPSSNVAALTPTQVSGLLLWLKADAGVYKDAGTTLAANGETVQQWNDQSGNGNHVGQATAGKRPSYVTGVQNSLPIVRFAGGQCLTLASISLTTFMVGVMFRSSGTAGIIYEQSADINANDGVALYGASGSSIAVRKGGTFSTRNINATWALGDEWFSVGHFYGGDHPNHHVAIANAWLGYATGTGNNPGSGSTAAGLNIGARNNAASLGLTGDVGEIFFYSPAPSMDNAKALMQYMASRWNIP